MIVPNNWQMSLKEGDQNHIHMKKSMNNIIFKDDTETGKQSRYWPIH